MYKHELTTVREAMGLDVELITCFINDLSERKGDTIVEYMKYLHEKYGSELLHKLIAYVLVTTLEGIDDSHIFKNYVYLLVLPDFYKHDRVSQIIEAFCKFFAKIEKELNLVTYFYVLYYFMSTPFFIDEKGEIRKEYYETIDKENWERRNVS